MFHADEVNALHDIWDNRNSRHHRIVKFHNKYCMYGKINYHSSVFTNGFAIDLIQGMKDLPR